MVDSSRSIEANKTDTIRNVAQSSTTKGEISSAFDRQLAILSCIAFSAICSLTIVRSSLLDNYGIWPLAAISAVALIFILQILGSDTLKTIGRTCLLIGAAMISVAALSLFTQDTVVWSAIIAMPAIIVSLSILLPHKISSFSIGALIAILCLYLPTLDLNIDSNSTVASSHLILIVLPVAYITSIWIAIAMVGYRRSGQSIISLLENERARTKIANSELEEMIATQLLREEMQIKLQQTGKMSGWWFDISSFTFFTGTTNNNDERVIVSLPLEEDLSLTEEALEVLAKTKHSKKLIQWYEYIAPDLCQALSDLQSWDKEFNTDIDSPLPTCFRSIGELKYGKDGADYIIGVVQDISATKALTQRLEYQANYDHLTSLRNRRSVEALLQTKVGAARCEAATYYYLFIDLDRFKSINDTSGHVAGDVVLKLVAKIVRKHLGDNEIAGRIGGDEFCILLENTDEDSALAVAESVREDIEAICFAWENTQHRIGATIGVVCVDERIESIDHLQLLADNACLEAKCAGRNRTKLTHADSQSAHAQRENSRWLQRLNEALANDLFVLCAQEIRAVGKPNNLTKSFEILIRMRDKQTQDLIPPGAFLPIAERYNLCSNIDLWVVTKLIGIIKEQTSIGNEQNTYWINLSGQSVGDKEFASTLVQTVKESNLPPGTLNFEVTETCVIQDIDVAILLIEQLKELGCQFALDDFGAGLASFGQLKKLPVDVIKIDGMFIREIQNGETDRLFAKSIIELAHSLGIETVAEFVENDFIRQTVTDLGIDYIQGFGIHRPEEISETGTLLKQAI